MQSGSDKSGLKGLGVEAAGRSIDTTRKKNADRTYFVRSAIGFPV